MFGFSLGKLLILALLVLLVWYGFKYMQRVEAVRQALRAEFERRRAARKPPTNLEAEDLVKCAVCASYVPSRSTSSCGRVDCPWGR